MNHSSRRKFLRNATTVFATGLVANSVLGKSIVDKPAENRNRELICRTLGRTGVSVPIVSMGVMNSNNPNLLKAGWHGGIRHFDTAWYYQAGNNERMVGQIIRDLNIERKDVIVTTKILVDRNLWSAEAGAERKKQFYSRFEQSMERLQMDYVDILMIHDVSTIEQVNDPFIIEAMQDLKDKGRIRFPAFSSHIYWPELLTSAADKGFYDVALLSFNYSMANDDTSFKAMKYAAEKGIGLIAMKTQCQQAWYKEALPAETQKFYEGAIMHSALLKWVLNQDFITTAVPGFVTFEQLQTDLVVGSDLNYTQEERTFLEDHNVKLALNSVCRFCGGCKGSCPHGVDIPSLMRTHMYAMSYGNLHMTKDTLKSIENGCGLDVCNNCETCIAQCLNSVQIAGRIGELKEIFI